MDSNTCKRKGCSGTIEDGYCDVCGMAELKTVESFSQAVLSSQRQSARSASITTGTGSSPLTNRSKGSRRTSSTSARSTRKQLGAGLVSIPDLPSTEPEKAILVEAKVPENKRFCSNCNNSLKREKGFCSKCGTKYSFIASLNPGDLVAGQYEVKGAIAYGGLGWIYLGFDKTLSRYVVLKGLLNTEDAASAAVAVAERQFLASVKHANIVGIYNFVKHGTEGFIIMEYVGGKTLKEIRKTRGALPVTEAIAYIHRILSAFAYLHSQGLVYCDFKPDNIMLEGHDVKLIDMGGVRRIDDPYGDIYGTVGYSAPEAGEGPTIVSDLFTIGRSLAVLLTNIPGFSKEHLYTLPSPQEDSLFAQQESLYRFLLKATAENPDDRFQSADEMADQLLGVLREIVAIETNTPRPANSNIFGGDMLAMTTNGNLEVIKPDFNQLPIPILDASEPGFNAVLNASAIPDPNKRVASLKQIVQQYPKSKEALLRLANSLIDVAASHSNGASKIPDKTGKMPDKTGKMPDKKGKMPVLQEQSTAQSEYREVEEFLTQVEALDPWDWRILWYKGRSLMAQKKAKEAQAAFDQVYFDLPGELVPKLALGLAAEMAKNYKLAIHMYDLVSRTDPSYVSAAFGLARCLCATGDKKGAVAALERVPQSSNLFTRARVEIARTLINSEKTAPGAVELQAASMAVETLTLEGMEHHRLTRQVLETALNLVTSAAVSPNSSIKILGQTLQEVNLRIGLEKSLRAMAHLSTGDEKIRLVDEANSVRPRTLF